MNQIALCPECGNARGMLDACPHCGTATLPHLTVDTVELNIKAGNPTVEEALDQLARKIRLLQEMGARVVILIHGYGSSGEGGLIKRGVHEALESNRYADRVDDYYFGEQVAYGSPACNTLLKQRPGLKAYLRHFKAGNAGMTVLILGSESRSA